MKLILIMLLFSSCSLNLPVRKTSKEENVIDKVHKCVLELVGKHAVKAREAQEVCDNIYRRQG